jgi:hypothetical protein
VTRTASLSRRTALAGAALLVGELRPTAAQSHAEPDAKIDHCCGNGPPNLRLYGSGIHPILPDCCESTVTFNNPFFGDGGLLGQWYYVFVPDTTVVVTEYIDQNGISHKPKHYVVADYAGIIYRVEPGFTLGLQWSAGITPDFSTRGLGRKEGGAF